MILEVSTHLYCITNLVNDHRYIGMTDGLLSTRLANHVSAALRRKHEKSPIYAAIRKHGRENFVIEHLHTYTSRDLAAHAEKASIAYLKGNFPAHYYNAAPGGDGGATFTGRKHTPATLQKMRNSAIGRKMPPRSASHSAALAASLSGKKRPPEVGAKISATLRGIKHPPRSDQARLNASLAAKGKPKSLAHRAAQAESMRRSWARRRAEAAFVDIHRIGA